jgi:hypothetical protein
MIARDTTREARDAQLAAWRRLGPSGRIAVAWEMSETARELSVAAILRRDPSLSPEQARRMLLRRPLGAALFDAAFGATPPRPLQRDRSREWLEGRSDPAQGPPLQPLRVRPRTAERPGSSHPR